MTQTSWDEFGARVLERRKLAREGDARPDLAFVRAFVVEAFLVKAFWVKALGRIE